MDSFSTICIFQSTRKKKKQLPLMMIIMSKKTVMHVNAEKKETTERMICANSNTMLNVQSWFCYARALASQILMYTSSFSTLSIQTDFESDESLNLNQSKFIDLHFISICAFRMNPILLFFELFFVFVIQDFCLSCIGFITMRMQQRRETIPFYINQLYRGKKNIIERPQNALLMPRWSHCVRSKE